MVVEFRKTITLNNIVIVEIDNTFLTIEILAKYSVGKNNSLVIEVFNHDSELSLEMITRIAEDSFRTNKKLALGIMGLSENHTTTTLIESVIFDDGFEAEVYCTENLNTFNIIVDKKELYIVDNLRDIGLEEYMAREVLAHFVQSNYYNELIEALEMPNTIYVSSIDVIDWYFDNSDESESIKLDMANEMVDALMSGKTYTMNIEKLWDEKINKGAIRLGMTMNYKPINGAEFNETELMDYKEDYNLVLIK